MVQSRRNKCWCGDHNTEYSANGDGVCDMPCGGDAYDMCGGVYSMDIYSIDPSYLGCFSDPAGSRIFAWEASSNDMTAEASDLPTESVGVGGCSTTDSPFRIQ